MVDAFPQLNGTRATKAVITVPFGGIWTVDVAIDQQVTVTNGAALVQLGALSLTGTIFRAGDFTGTGVFRVVGGAGGWQGQLPPKFYRGAGSAGLKLSSVLNDTARAVGETVKIDTDVSIGSAYARGAGPAVRALNSLVGPWWMRFDGVTEVGTRATPTIISPFEVIPDGTNLALGRIVIATDNPEDWVPGSLFSSPTLAQRSVTSIVHYLEPNKVRTVVWTQ
jgi:hypothetical protein